MRFDQDSSGQKDGAEERKLTATEKTYQTILQTALDGFWLTDLQGRFLEVNQAYCELTGYSSQELLTMSISDVEASEQPEEVASHIETVMREGSDRFETRHRCIDGRIVDVEVSVTFLDLEGGRLIVFIRDITEKIRADKALRDSEKRFKDLTLSSADWWWETDPQGRFTFCSERVRDVLGYSPKEMEGKTPFDLMPEDEKERMYSLFLQAVARQQPLSDVENRNISKSGAEIVLLTNGVPILDDKGNLQGYRGVDKDITARKRTEEEVKRLSERLRLATEAAGIGIWEYDLADDQLFWSDVMYRLYGISSERFSGAYQAWANGVHPEDLPAAQEELETAIRDKQPFDTEFRVVWPDGTIRHLKAHAAVFKDPEKDKYQRMIGVNWDITERKQAEETLRENEERFRRIFDEGPLGMAIVNLDCYFVRVNAELCHILDYTPEELQELTFQEVTHPEDLPASLEQLEKVLRGEVSGFQMEKRYIRKNGAVIWANLSASLIWRDEETPLYYLIMVEDVTERKQIEEQLSAYTREMELKNIELENARDLALEASRAKSDFLATMSHEIRTPLNSIIGMGELLVETPLAGDQEEYVKIFKGAGENLLTLINDILDISKIEAGHLELETTEFDLVELVEKTAELMAFRAHEKGLELAARIRPDTPVFLKGDPGRLRQILVNLLGNAVKFTEKGEVVLVVEPAREVEGITAGEAAEDDSIEVLFSITDTGIGIPEEKQAAIFEGFTQADSSTTRKHGGTGLGLTISSRLVEMMGGQLKVKSMLGLGSTFYFTVSLKLGSDRDRLPQKATPRLELEGVKILVVDDHGTNRLILRETLEPQKAWVKEMEDGASALFELRKAAASGSPYRLLLLDCMMPEMDGFEVAETAIRELPDLAVIMLSSDMMCRERIQSKALEPDAFLVKPVKRQELFDAIARSLGDRKEQEAGKSAEAPETVDRAEADHQHQAPAEGEQAAPAYHGKQEKLAEAARGQVAPEQGKEDPGAAAASRPAASKSSTGETPTPGPASEAAMDLLLVEDNADNRLLINAYLKKTPHRVEMAENGAEAVEKVKSNRYDLVLMDIQMPVMDGYQATREIRRWEQESGKKPVPIIALTAYALKEEVQKALDAGCNQHLSKPVKKKVLLEAISQYA